VERSAKNNTGVTGEQYLAMLSVTTSRNDYAIYAELSRAKEYQMEETSALSERKNRVGARIHELHGAQVARECRTGEEPGSDDGESFNRSVITRRVLEASTGTRSREDASSS